MRHKTDGFTVYKQFNYYKEKLYQLKYEYKDDIDIDVILFKPKEC
jgi:hypothetical protein